METSKKIMKWTEFDYSDTTTWPHQNVQVLVSDILGNMQICLFDGITHDFLLSINGIDITERRDCIVSIIEDAICEKIGEKITEEIHDKIDEIIYSDDPSVKVYFTHPYAWMPLPNANPKLALFNVEDQCEYDLKVYSIFDKIEPALRRALDEMALK